ncbi:MAG: hypothetical protein II794_08540 [Oscillospiraceae bacterium]|nr:hypothetical protein [Oscillospiraceae bacterium]
MRKQLSFGQYRTIDLVLFALMLAVFEFIIISAATRWFPDQLYTVSLAAAITSIVMMRWGPWGLIHAGLAGAAYCFFSGAVRVQYLMYILGNLFSAGSLVMLRLLGGERIRQSQWLSLAFGLLTWLLMCLGRMAMALIFGAGFGDALAFLTTDSLSAVFTLVIVWIARRLDGIFENQKHYLLRLNKEREEEKGGTL